MNFLDHQKAEYYTHDLKEERPFKVIIRGLPLLDTNDLVDELKVKHKLDVLEVHRIKRRNEESISYHQQLYLAHFKRGTCSMAKLEAIRALHSIIIRWEPYRGGRKGPTQCLRCQGFGHGTRNCHIQPRCAVCAQMHLTDECNSSNVGDPAVKCINCGNNHSAGDKECLQRAKYIEVRKWASERTKKSQLTSRPSSMPPPASRNTAWSRKTPKPPIPAGFEYNLAQRLANAQASGFGHGTRNCHIQPRCAVCAQMHLTDECNSSNVGGTAVKCINCGNNHSARDKECPQRAQYIEVRKWASERTKKSQPTSRKNPAPALNS
uniref:Pre-C2HC domain-containing protein n=1 Tax=Anopheles arabiensis TaxID=7173 RepID=A0A182IEQ4_ANOAR